MPIMKHKYDLDIPTVSLQNLPYVSYLNVYVDWCQVYLKYVEQYF